MSKTILFLHGSPRPRGNTRAAAKIAMEELASLGITVDDVETAKLTFKHPGCVSCYQCQQSEAYGCHLDDAVAKVVGSMPDYDALVLATPLYWFSFPAQIKIVIDRMFSLIKFTANGGVTSPLAGKPMGLLATAGGGIESNLALLEAQWKIPAEKMGSPFCSCLLPFTQEPGSLAKNETAVAQVREFARTLGTLVQG
jgi:multimeric flavodoxin WrbA